MTSIAHNHVATNARSQPRFRAGWWLPVSIVAAHVLLAMWWSLVVPIGEGPDEPGHFHYALFLAQEGRLPVQQADSRLSDVPGEGHQPPLAYWLMQPAVRWLAPDELQLEMGPNPEFQLNGGDEPNAYLGSSRDTWPYSGIGRAWHLARFISALLGGVTVALTYATARKCFPTHIWIAAGAAALLALNPQFIFSHALVSNDPLLFALATGLIFVCVVIAQPAQKHAAQGWAASFRAAVTAGVLLGLLLITKQNGLALAPLPFLAFFVQRRDIKQWLINSASVAAVAALISGWWYARNVTLYGDLLGLDSFQQTFAPNGYSNLTLQSIRGGLWNLLRSSWGNFGWLTLPLNDGAYWAFATFVALAVIGVWAGIGQGWWKGYGSVALVLAAAVGLVFAWTLAFAVVADAVAWQGRFLFPAASALAIGFVCGLGLVLPRRTALIALLALLLLLAIALPPGLIAPASERYVLEPQPANSGNTYARLDIGWKRGVELRNAEYPPSATAGDALNLTLTWHALEQLDQPYLVFVHVVDEQGNIVAERNAQPKDGKFPTNSWVRGDWLRDSQQVPLEGVAPGTYRLYIGLWDEQNDKILDVFDRDGAKLGWRFNIGTVTVNSRT